MPGAEAALQRYLLHDVTGRSELGGGWGSNLARFSLVMQNPPQRDTQKPTTCKQGQAGMENPLDWASDTWDFVELCIYEACSHPSLGLSLPIVICGGVTIRPCLGAFLAQEHLCL